MEFADRIIENFEPHRRQSESVVAAFPAGSHNQILVTIPAAIAGIGAFVFDRSADSIVWVLVPLVSLLPVVWFMVVNRNYTVIATNERTVVARSSRFSVLQVLEPIEELPVDVQIGPASGLITYTTSALVEPLRIHRRAFDQVRRADERESEATPSN